MKFYITTRDARRAPPAWIKILVTPRTDFHFLRQRFKPLKLYPVMKHLQKVVCFILFIYSRAFHNNVISDGKSYSCNDTFTDVRFTSPLAKNI